MNPLQHSEIDYNTIFNKNQVFFAFLFNIFQKSFYFSCLKASRRLILKPFAEKLRSYSV